MTHSNLTVLLKLLGMLKNERYAKRNSNARYDSNGFNIGVYPTVPLTATDKIHIFFNLDTTKDTYGGNFNSLHLFESFRY